jgi:hypothetical protein
MSNRNICALAAILIVPLAGLYSQAIPVADNGTCSVSSRESSDAENQDQGAAAADDSDDVPDDFLLLHGMVNPLPSVSVAASLLGHQTSSCSSYSSMTATLESQHILLRL